MANNGSSLWAHWSQRIDRKYQWILLTGQLWTSWTSFVDHYMELFFSSPLWICICIILNVVHSSWFSRICCTDPAWLSSLEVLAPLCVSYSLFQGITVGCLPHSACVTFRMTSHELALCAPSIGTFTLSAITFKRFVRQKGQIAVICLTLIISVCLV